MVCALDLREFLAPALLCASLLGVSLACEAAVPAKMHLHVSAKGSDSWDGTSARPFATLDKARDFIRELKKSNRGVLAGPVEVVIHGELTLLKPFVLSADDSGTRNCTIVYRGEKGSRIVGGVCVNAFEPVTDKDVLDTLEPAARDNVVKADLRKLGLSEFGAASAGGAEVFFNDNPLTLARWPNEGFVKIADVLKNQPVDIRGTKGDAVGDIVYEGDRPSRWLNEKDPWVHGYWFWDWSDQSHQIESIEPSRNLIRIKPPYHSYGYRKGQWFYAYNLLSEIDRPGEWYLDRSRGILYLWPPEDPARARVVVSAAETAIKAQAISHIRFESLTVEAVRGNAIHVTNPKDVLFSNCIVRNAGGVGIVIANGERCTVRDCEVYNVGRAGVSISGGDRLTLTPSNNQVLGCHIHNYGRIARMYSAGVALGGVGTRVAHCEIHDAPHQAIGFGGNNHVMEYNEIYRVCAESNDAGAIYAGRDWTMLENVVRFNYFHDITGFENRGCVGVYLDDFFCGTTIYGNVFKNVSRAAMVGGGNYNTIENNLFIDCVPCIHLDARGEGWAKDYFDGSYPDLINKMKAVNYKSSYYAKYTWLQTAMDEPNPGHPRGNRFVRNVGIGGRWEDVEGKARPGNEFADNTVSDDRSLLTTNAGTGIPDLTPAAYRKTGLKPIPTGKIGRR